MHPQFLHLGRIALPVFGLLAAVGLMAALSLSLRTAAKVGLDPDRVWNAGLFMLLAAFVLSRLLLVAGNLDSFRAYPLAVLALPSLTPVGVLATLFATGVYLYLRHLPLLRTLDVWAPCATLAWGFLALGHYAEGSDPGMVTSLPWSILSPTGLSHLHPVALYAAAAAAVLTFVLLRHLSPLHPSGRTAALGLAAAGVAQFFITFYREPSFDELPPAFELLDPIQWAAVAMIVAAGLLLLMPERQVADAV